MDSDKKSGGVRGFLRRVFQPEEEGSDALPLEEHSAPPEPAPAKQVVPPAPIISRPPEPPEPSVSAPPSEQITAEPPAVVEAEPATPPSTIEISSPPRSVRYEPEYDGEAIYGHRVDALRSQED